MEQLAAMFGKTQPQPTSDPMYCPPPEMVDSRRFTTVYEQKIANF